MRRPIVPLLVLTLALLPVAQAMDLGQGPPDVPEGPPVSDDVDRPVLPEAPEAPELLDDMPEVPDVKDAAPDGDTPPEEAVPTFGGFAWLDQARQEAEREYEEARDGTDRAVRDLPEDIERGLGHMFRDNQQAAGPDAPDDETLGFAERFREAVDGPMMVAGIAGLGATALGLVGFAAVTRYISPKEALKNPQRAMLYGFIRATPGAHLKQLSDEFKMKTSSILWHIRKLESADLVHSERANGFRVFYPTEGGIDAKRLSRAITALHNPNAQAIQEAVNRRPGHAVKDISERLTIHSGTVRWHLRKLRDFGLIEELLSDDGSRFFPTPLGKEAIEAAVGKPTVAANSGSAAASSGRPAGGE